MTAPRLRVADVFRAHWTRYDRTHSIAPHQGKAIRHLLRCRTAALGGHLYRCDSCGSELPVYNSCQNRHCPTCQSSAREHWLSERKTELLPVPYFHVVFTLPHELNGLVDANRSCLLGELFSTANWVLQRFAADPQWRLEGELGVLAILHTWNQKLQEHFHLHCIVPGGAWRQQEGKWIPCRRQWLFRKDSLADAFRNRYLTRLCMLRQQARLTFTGPASSLADDAAWSALIEGLTTTRWVAYPKAAAGGAEKVLEYLGRYTHKGAISDHRIKALQDGVVTYTWRDRADGNQEKTATLPADEFIRRFLYHILPRGFQKIRYYGWLSATKRRVVLPAIRRALHVATPEPEPEQTLVQRILTRTGVDLTLCPGCGNGHLRITRSPLPRPQGRSP
jgi:hypothetical protein